MFGRPVVMTCQTANVDERPPVWVGHIVLNVSDLDRSARFWHAVGMRMVEQNPHVAVLELRGGTHLVLVPGTPQPGGAPFDLMVDDLDATRAAWQADVLAVSEIERGRIHSAFTVPDPDGYVVTVNSTHVVGPV
jgi:catechol 2,3-dioxygenase-like lactoylglutathione lyase family enzyme